MNDRLKELRDSFNARLTETETMYLAAVKNYDWSEAAKLQAVRQSVSAMNTELLCALMDVEHGAQQKGGEPCAR